MRRSVTSCPVRTPSSLPPTLLRTSSSASASCAWNQAAAGPAHPHLSRALGACSTSSPFVIATPHAARRTTRRAAPSPLPPVSPHRTAPRTACRAAAPDAEPTAPDPSDDDQPVGPWSREDMESMMDEQYQEEDQALGGTWRQFFQDDPESLFDNGERAQEELGAAYDYISSIADPRLQAYEADQYKLPPAIINNVMGMGSWKLNGSTDPAIEFLCSTIESTWRELLDDDLNIYPVERWKAHGWDWCDSMDPERELEGFAHDDVPDPEPGEEGYPRLFLENRIYCSKVFRKLHIEVGWRQDGLHVLHVVLYPRYKYDLPILALDLVVTPTGRVSLAIIDACPLSHNKMLPAHYMQTMQELQQLLLTDPSNQRNIPDWGKAVFSPLCVCMTPKDGEELAGFMKYVISLHRAHLMLSKLLPPLDTSERRGSAKAQEVLEGHKRFVDNMLANQKTSRVLEAAFGQEWGQQYMHEVMFDFSPDFEPPFTDASIFKLYDYFDENPELGTLPEDAMQLQDSIDQERAEEFLDDLLMSPQMSGAARPAARSSDDDDDVEAGPGSLSSISSITRKRSEWALVRLYETDAVFRANVDDLIPDAQEMLLDGSLGAVLADQLRGALGYAQPGREAEGGSG